MDSLRPTYDYAQAGVLKRTIRRTCGWKPLSLVLRAHPAVIDKLVNSG